MSNLSTTVLFTRSFKVFKIPLKYWEIKRGGLFFTEQEYQRSGCDSNLMIKLDDEHCMISDLWTVGLIDKDADVYFVLKA